MAKGYKCAEKGATETSKTLLRGKCGNSYVKKIYRSSYNRVTRSIATMQRSLGWIKCELSICAQAFMTWLKRVREKNRPKKWWGKMVA